MIKREYLEPKTDVTLHEADFEMSLATPAQINKTVVDVGNCEIPEKEVTESVVKETKKPGCIKVTDLWKEVKLYADGIFFNSISREDFVSYVNIGLRNLYSLNETAWNWSLEEKYEIDLETGKCEYDLPYDFLDLSYVGTCSESDCCPVGRIFDIVNPNEIDTVPDSRYAAAFTYDVYTENAKLIVRMPCMSNCSGCNCDCSCKNHGSLCIKYYTCVPEVDNWGDEICSLPVKWGAKDVLVQLIAQAVHSVNGKPYHMAPSYQLTLGKLIERDKGMIPSNPIHRTKPMTIKVVRR